LKRAEVLKAGSVKTTPLNAGAFIGAKVKSDSMGKITKKQIREAARNLGMVYDEEKILFTKRVWQYLMKNGKER
jgi:ABC-type ATPase involved in cell division